MLQLGQGQGQRSIQKALVLSLVCAAAAALALLAAAREPSTTTSRALSGRERGEKGDRERERDDDRKCNLESVNLLDFEQWKNEEGLWVGKYLFTSAENFQPYKSDAWNYPYGSYTGFIRMKLVGNTLIQRNVFMYPPQSPDRCFGSKEVQTPFGPVTYMDKKGSGECGINGNEKVFEALVSSVDCNGNVGGPSFIGGSRSETSATLVGDKTIVYEVKLPPQSYFESDPSLAPFAAFADNIIQEQLTTVFPHGLRVRTAQGFNAFAPTETSSTASFYIENKITIEEFRTMTAAIREEYNILPDDYCGWDSANNRIENPDCDVHFMLEDFVA
jgi:hypothetical protein